MTSWHTPAQLADRGGLPISCAPVDHSDELRVRFAGAPAEIGTLLDGLPIHPGIVDDVRRTDHRR